MYIEAITIFLIIGLYFFVILQFRTALKVLVNRVNLLDNQIAEAITKLPFQAGGDFEPINPLQQAFANILTNMAMPKQERAENGQFVKATIIEPAERE
tara:strand:- start:639 stop:932 length:294 start_codon:yes stop_codon:yes gene_type:complete